VSASNRDPDPSTTLRVMDFGELSRAVRYSKYDPSTMLRVMVRYSNHDPSTMLRVMVRYSNHEAQTRRELTVEARPRPMGP